MKINDIITNWKMAQESGATLPCPRCGKMTMKDNVYQNALSRRADIHICDTCGMEEAFEDFQKHETPLGLWFVVTNVYGIPSIKPTKNGDYVLTVSRTIRITNQDIDDIMVSALEGGINYWCDNAEVVEDSYLGEYASDQISRGGSLRLHDSEDDSEYILTRDMFLNGFYRACRDGYGNGRYSWFDNGALDTYNIDAEAADIIIQYALFGEAIYG